MSLYYPQLSSGAIAQLPFRRSQQRRTAINQTVDGYRYQYADAGAATINWKLSYSHLTDQERQAIEALFETCGGQFGTFTFLDPAGNLLAWSEDFAQSVWTIDPLIQTQPGIADPFGGSAATTVTNAGQASQSIAQQLPIAASFQYCFSVYARCEGACVLTMAREGSGETTRTSAAVGSEWTRIIAAQNLVNDADVVTFRFELPPGGRVTLAGAQVEAQPSAGAYKKNFDAAGIYPQSRFASDLLLIQATGPNQNSCTVDVISAVSA